MRSRYRCADAYCEGMMHFRVTAYVFCLFTFSAPFPALSATKHAPEAQRPTTPTCASLATSCQDLCASSSSVGVAPCNTHCDKRSSDAKKTGVFHTPDADITCAR